MRLCFSRPGWGGDIGGGGWGWQQGRPQGARVCVMEFRKDLMACSCIFSSCLMFWLVLPRDAQCLIFKRWIFLLCLQDWQLNIEENPHFKYLKLHLGHFCTQNPPPHWRERKVNCPPWTQPHTTHTHTHTRREWMYSTSFPLSDGTGDLPGRQIHRLMPSGPVLRYLYFWRVVLRFMLSGPKYFFGI